jgi:hypothetical protein
VNPLQNAADCLDQAEHVYTFFQEAKALRVLFRRLGSAPGLLPRPRLASRRQQVDALRLTVISPMTSKA